MSFRKRTVAKPNVGTQRRKTDNVSATNTVVELSDGKVAGTRLSKRSKVTPNFKARLQVPENSNVKSEVIVSSTVEEITPVEDDKITDLGNLLKHNDVNVKTDIENCVSESTQENNCLKVESKVNIESQPEVVQNDSDDNRNILKGEIEELPKANKCLSNNRLQKRRRVTPKLTKREPKIDVNKAPALKNDASEQTRSVELNNTLRNENIGSKGDDKQDATLLSTVDDTEKNTSNVKQTSCSNSFSPNTLLTKDTESKRNQKQVHFVNLSDETNQQNSNRSYDNTLNEKDETTENSEKKETCNRRSGGYSSQSDGESSTTVGGLKNRKVFRPNLGARRRKRLSSFSAYSSCDDGDQDEENSHVHKKTKNELKIKEKEKSEQEDITDQISEQSAIQRVPKKKKKKKEKLEKEILSDSDNEHEDEPTVSKKPRTTHHHHRICTEEKDMSTLTMQELIHYRPKSFQKVELRSKKKNDKDIEEVAVLVPNDEEELETKPTKKEENISIDVEIGDEDDFEVMAPQVMLDENGEVIINERSLTISKKVDDSILRKSSVVFEDSLSSNNHRRKIGKVKRWKMEETLRFYKALSQIGTDFTLMSQAFGRFTRNDLKKKFKQEEKVNCDLVDMALLNRLPLNMELFLRGKAEMNELLAETKRNTSTDDCEMDSPSSIDKQIDDSTNKITNKLESTTNTCNNGIDKDELISNPLTSHTNMVEVV